MLHLNRKCFHSWKTLILFRRTVYLKSGTWPIDEHNDGYTEDIRQDVESFWREKLQEDYEKYLEESKISSKKKFYCLSMFPYPSGQLHMGHVRVYSLSNLFAHYYRLRGYSVIHPIGWDSFGLPAENAAIQRGLDTEVWTKENIALMKEQLGRLDLCMDWSREVVTSDPAYYKWTQWIFLQLFHRGLAYRDFATVNWDPVDCTVLANEQVDEEGKSWRSGASVQKIQLKQWFFHTIGHSRDLQNNLKTLSLWPKSVKTIQKNWIGTQPGIVVKFPVVDANLHNKDFLKVFTPFPDSIKEATGVLLNKNHYLLKEFSLSLINPLSGDLLPLKASDLCFDESEIKYDFDELPPKPDYAKNVESHFEFLEAFMKDNPSLRGVITYNNLRDWLISRQRFWGTPIPIIHCDSCGQVPVPEADLPVTLPKRSPGKNLLGEYEEWVNVPCPNCGGNARRETDTMDTFVDSAWYYLRYLDPSNKEEIYSAGEERRNMPVDLYIGGIEHARLHLLYARFMMHVLKELNVASYSEPFLNLLCQGTLLSKSFRLKSSGTYVPQREVEGSKDDELTHVKTGEEIVCQFEKMSKSKFNGVSPDELIDAYGSDTVKCYVLDNINPAKNILFKPDNLIGVIRWKNRLWLLTTNFINELTTKTDTLYMYSNKNTSLEKMWRERNRAVHSFELMNCETVSELRPDTVMRNLQSLTNILKGAEPAAFSETVFQRCLLDLIIMVSPFLPLISCELWSGVSAHVKRDLEELDCYDLSQSVLRQSWPQFVKLNL